MLNNSLDERARCLIVARVSRWSLSLGVSRRSTLARSVARGLGPDASALGPRRIA